MMISLAALPTPTIRPKLSSMRTLRPVTKFARNEEAAIAYQGVNAATQRSPNAASNDAWALLAANWEQVSDVGITRGVNVGLMARRLPLVRLEVRC
jgi:hypothetical protein